MTDWYLNPVFDSFAAVAAVAVALLVLIGLGFHWRRTTRRRAATLAILRLIALLVLLLAMLQPTWVTTVTKLQSATLVLLIDSSRSMLVPDMTPQRTRWEELRKLLAQAAPELAALASEVELKCYEFDATTRTLAVAEGRVPLADTPRGQQTAIGAALEEVLRQERGKRLIGVVLVSDGAQQSLQRTQPPQDLARRMADQGYPLYTVCLGGAPGSHNIRDIAIANLAAGPTVYVKNELAIHAELQIDGYANQELPVEVLWGKTDQPQVVARAAVTADAPQVRIPVNLTHVPTETGEHKLTIRVPPQPGELVTTNNERTTYITVLDGGLKVLYVEAALGSQRVEQAFLRRSLAASPDIQVDYRRVDNRHRQHWPLESPKVEAWFEPDKYDVYLFGDIDSDAFKQGQTHPELEKLRAAIEKGAGFVMLGGFHSFAPGGYGGTPLAKALPLEMHALDRQNFDETARADLHHLGQLRMVPTTLGRDHPLLRLGPPADNLAVWNNLPKLDGANLLPRAQLKPAAQVLAEGVNGQSLPLLVSTNYGTGRVLAFAADSTWRWRLQGAEEQHKRFWRQLILWLAKQDAQPGEVWVRLERRTTPLGQPLRFTCGARGPAGESLTDAQFTILVQPPDKTHKPIPVSVTKQGDTFAGTFVDALVAGEHTLTVTARRNDAPLGEAQARFLVEADDLELAHPAPDPQLMQSLARITAEAGGEYVVPEQFLDLLRRLKQKPKQLDIEIPYRWTFGTQPADALATLAVFVTLLGVEWFLRKKWGLV